ncbi:MAG: TolC family protein, partial [Muribaculaceae bacterium]
MLQGQTDIARHKIAMARADYLPQIGLVGQDGYFNVAKLNGRKLIDGGSWLVGVQLSIPIYDFGHRYNKIKAAKAQYAQAVAERDDTYEML